MRQKQLIETSFRNFILASVISTAVITVNSMADAFLMGTLLGAEALSAVDLTLPINYILMSIQDLLAAGTAILISRKHGELEYEEADKIFTVSLLSFLVAGALCAICGLFMTDEIAGMLCSSSELFPLVRDYIHVELGLGIVIMLQLALAIYANQMGYPRIALRANILCVVVNLGMDIVYVRLFGSGVTGAAFATVTGSAAAIIYLAIFFLGKNRPLKLKLPREGLIRILSKNISMGIPSAMISFGVFVVTYILNYFVQKILGTDGIFVLTVGMTFLAFSLFFCMGIQQAILSMGSMLMGQKDFSGLRILFKSCMMYSMPVTLALAMLLVLFPKSIANAFGAKTAELLEMSAAGLPRMAVYGITIAILLMFSALYIVEGHEGLVSMLTLLFMILIPLSLWVSDRFLPPDKLWTAFLGSGIISAAICISVSLIYGYRIRNSAEIFTLIPRTDAKTSVYECTIPVDAESFSGMLKESVPFFESLSIDYMLGMRIRLCVEEMIAFSVAHKSSKPNYMDVRITVTGKDISVLIKDNCPEYNPLHCKDDDLNLMIIHSFCPRTEYQYSFGQNMTYMYWEDCK